ncbi:hypothetical protein BpHYR1_014000 [Brachionus plicatilis]|uniref:Uncharacterized protein n=1 Tax=Brachionus plicatilis TaxID=10195 RepID=A0A3M7QVH4_BRAPC|nr:hypothetical protein BpHYR1_014000 [Brachionus plicatilis]
MHLYIYSARHCNKIKIYEKFEKKITQNEKKDQLIKIIKCSKNFNKNDNENDIEKNNQTTGNKEPEDKKNL